MSINKAIEKSKSIELSAIKIGAMSECEQHEYRVHNQGNIVCVKCLKVLKNDTREIEYMTREDFEYDPR